MFLFLSLKNSLNEIIGEDTVGEDDDKDEEDVEDEDVSLSSVSLAVSLAILVPIAVSLPNREKSEGSGKPDDSPETREINSDAEIEEDEEGGGGGIDSIKEKSMDTLGRGV